MLTTGALLLKKPEPSDGATGLREAIGTNADKLGDAVTRNVVMLQTATRPASGAFVGQRHQSPDTGDITEWIGDEWDFDRSTSRATCAQAADASASAGQSRFATLGATTVKGPIEWNRTPYDSVNAARLRPSVGGLYRVTAEVTATGACKWTLGASDGGSTASIYILDQRSPTGAHAITMSTDKVSLASALVGIVVRCDIPADAAGPVNFSVRELRIRRVAA